ncbi:MAG: hypothetical protein K6F27_10925 [Ruminococcus sp.]|nr:hypothetical protein [Ruminococcus sp.]
MTSNKTQTIMPEAVKTYLKVLESSTENYPANFFSEGSKKKHIIEIVTYLCEKEEITTSEKAHEVFTEDYIKNNKLKLVVKNAPRVVELLPEDHTDLYWLIHPEEQPSYEELVIKVADDVANARRSGFPQKYFHGVQAKEKAIMCFKYLCESILHYDRKTIREKFDCSEGIKILAKYKYRIILQCVFPSVSQLLVAAYPDIFNTDLDEPDEAPNKELNEEPEGE